MDTDKARTSALPPRLQASIGWDAVSSVRKRLRPLIGRPAEDLDLDLCCLLLGKDGKPLSPFLNSCCVYYASPRHLSGAVMHMGNNRTGAGEGDNERVVFDLSRMPENVSRAVLAVNLYGAKERKQHLGMVKNGFFRLTDLDGGKELVRMEIGKGLAHKSAVIAAELIRKNDDWLLEPVLKGISGSGSVNDVADEYR